MNSLSTNFLGIKMKSPLLTASGTFGYGNELTDLIDITKIGAIVTKTITLEERLGNPQPRIAEVASGMLNTIGLQNIGVKKFIFKLLIAVLLYLLRVFFSIIILRFQYKKLPDGTHRCKISLRNVYFSSNRQKSFRRLRQVL